MALEVDRETFATTLAAGTTVIDVREPDEFAAGHVAGARSIPLSQVADRVTELFLGQAEVDARSVAGGTGGRQHSGRPVVTGSGA